MANLVELAETGVVLKSRRMAFPGQAAMREECLAPRLDSAYLASWTTQYMAMANA